MNPDASFGQWLKQRRKLLDLTQSELAHRVGCAASMLQKIEASQRRPSPEFAARLAEVLGIPPEQRPALVEFARTDKPPPSRSPTNLPAPPTPLIGRERDAAEVRQRLMREDTRLLTLVGPPGIGKTRLALQVAADVRAHFDDGVFFIALASITEPALVAPTIVQALGFYESKHRPPLNLLCDHVHDKVMLLVLDNLEQVIAVAPMIARLLAVCPLLKILATSRIALRVRAERQFHVPSLRLPDVARLHPPQQLLQYPALALFVERAQAVQPDFSLTEANASTVACICYRLDGLPLAIELVAARARLLPPAEILRLLSGQFLLQSDDLRDIDERQRTLKKAIEWSYNLLTSDEQSLFVRLAVFVGGWTLDAAERVTSGGWRMANGEANVTSHLSPITLDVLNGLTALVNKSLVMQHPGEDESRFFMLETIREYALERLAALQNGEAQTIRRRHSIYYLRLAEAARSQLTSAQQVRWLDRLENEHGNLRTALGWALESRNVTIAAQLGGALSHFWVMHGHLSEGRRWLERTLATDTALFHLSPSIRVVLLNGVGSLAYYQGDHTAARLYFEEGLALARQVGDQWNVAFALDGLGAQFANQGDYEQAQAFSEQSLALSRSIGDKWLSGITLINLGELARVQGDYGRAILCYEESLALLREGGDRLFMAIVLHDLGQMAQDQGQYDQAKTIHVESLVLCRALGSQRGIAMCLEKLAGIAVARCQPERAARLLGATEALRQTIAAPMGAADRADYERFVTLAHAGLDDNTFAAAWAEGRTMTLEQAIAYALTAGGTG